MTTPLELQLQLMQLRRHSLLHRLALDLKLSALRGSACVREPEEVEGLRRPELRLLSVIVAALVNVNVNGNDTVGVIDAVTGPDRSMDKEQLRRSAPIDSAEHR